MNVAEEIKKIADNSLMDMYLRLLGADIGVPKAYGIKYWITKPKGEKTMREFSGGATRDDDDTKPDYEGYLSPLAIRRYGEYMTKHRVQADGKLRDSDNWQKGIPPTAYMKSLWRHMVELWSIHRGFDIFNRSADYRAASKQEALCAIIFNAFGYLHELEIRDNGEIYSAGVRETTSI